MQPLKMRVNLTPQPRLPRSKGLGHKSTRQKPTTTPIPVQLSEPACTALLLPHLSMPKRGPKGTLGYYRVFHLILWVLDTGMQWKCLPVPTDAQGHPASHYTTVYKVFATWADDGSL